jgi:hypothetical protein
MLGDFPRLQFPPRSPAIVGIQMHSFTMKQQCIPFVHSVMVLFHASVTRQTIVRRATVFPLTKISPVVHLFLLTFQDVSSVSSELRNRALIAMPFNSQI